jgi:hypothetical protein
MNARHGNAAVPLFHITLLRTPRFWEGRKEVAWPNTRQEAENRRCRRFTESSKEKKIKKERKHIHGLFKKKKKISTRTATIHGIPRL